MANLFYLNISTPEKTIFDGTTQSLVAPGTIGYVGILANHAPFITTLVPGRITAKDALGKAFTYQSAGNGILEVFKDRATILLDTIEAQV